MPAASPAAGPADGGGLTNPRRGRQFSLRTAFVMLTLAAVVFGVLSPPRVRWRREQAAIEVIRNAGGKVLFAHTPTAGQDFLALVLDDRVFLCAFRVDLSYSAIRDEQLASFSRLSQLRELSLQGTHIGDRGLAQLVGCANLEELDLRGTRVTDAGLAELAHLPNLQGVQCTGTAISYEALAALSQRLVRRPSLSRQRALEEIQKVGAKVLTRKDPGAETVDEIRFYGSVNPATLRHLEYLSEPLRLKLIGCQLSSADLGALGGVSTLGELDLGGSQLPEDLSPLAGLRRLRILRLSLTNLTNAGLQQIAQLPELQQLEIAATQVTGAGLQTLGQCRSLQELDLSELSGIDVQDLWHLGALPDLRDIVTDSRRLSYREVIQLRTAFPQIQLVRPCGPQPAPFGPPLTTDNRFDIDAAQAFRTGDFDSLLRILEWRVAEDPESWEHQFWIGHACQLEDRWQEAVTHYRLAASQLAATFADRPADSRQRLAVSPPISAAAYHAQLVLLAGQLRRVELTDAAGATETLQAASRFTAALTRPLGDLVSETAAELGRLETPTSKRSDSSDHRELVYPLLAHEQLAMAYQSAGQPREALDCWNRLRLLRVHQLLTFPEVDPRQLASLWNRLPVAEPLPEMPTFLLLDAEGGTLRFDPRDGAARLACWDRNAWTAFAMLAPPGRLISRLRVVHTVVDAGDPDPGLLRWSTESPFQADADRRSCIPDSAEADGPYRGASSRRLTAAIEDPAPLVFLYVPDGTASVDVSASLLPGEVDPPAAASSPPQPASVRDLDRILKPDGPFQPPPDAPRKALAAADQAVSLIRRDDGRLVCAWGSTRISLSSSVDGVHWETPWDYEHNGIFVTGGPSLVSEPGGRLWMLYSSTRPAIELASRYHLWLSHSDEGRVWSTPVPVTLPLPLAGRPPACVRAAPRGGYAVFLRRHWGWGPSLLELKPFGGYYPVRTMQSGQNVGVGSLQADEASWAGEVRDGANLGPLPVPWGDEFPPLQVHATFDDRGRCHVVCRYLYRHSRKTLAEFGYASEHARVIQYVWSDDLSTWHLDRQLVPHREGEDPSWPHLIIEGNRVALLYSEGRRWLLQRGTMVDGKPQLGSPIELTDGDLKVQCPRVYRSGDRLYLPLPGEPMQLLQADVVEVVGSDR